MDDLSAAIMALGEKLDQLHDDLTRLIQVVAKSAKTQERLVKVLDSLSLSGRSEL